MKAKYGPWSLALSAVLLAGLGHAETAKVDLTKLVDLKTQKPLAETKKSKRLFYFWATWCPDCKQKLAETLPKLNGRGDVEVLTVNVDSDVERAQHFVEKQNIGLPVLRDGEKTLASQLKVFSVPHWAVMEKDGSQNWQIKASEAGSNEDHLLTALGSAGAGKK